MKRIFLFSIFILLGLSACKEQRKSFLEGMAAGREAASAEPLIEFMPLDGLVETEHDYYEFFFSNEEQTVLQYGFVFDVDVQMDSLKKWGLYEFGDDKMESFEKWILADVNSWIVDTMYVEYSQEYDINNGEGQFISLLYQESFEDAFYDTHSLVFIFLGEDLGSVMYSAVPVDERRDYEREIIESMRTMREI